MPKFAIERAIPNIGATSAPDRQAISQKSCGPPRILKNPRPLRGWASDEARPSLAFVGRAQLIEFAAVQAGLSGLVIAAQHGMDPGLAELVELLVGERLDGPHPRPLPRLGQALLRLLEQVTLAGSSPT
jgi:hypothetical protein